MICGYFNKEKIVNSWYFRGVAGQREIRYLNETDFCTAYIYESQSDLFILRVLKRSSFHTVSLQKKQQLLQSEKSLHALVEQP